MRNVEIEKALERAGRGAVKGSRAKRSGRYVLRGTDYSYNPSGGPIDDPQGNARLLAALGLAIASWSRMEQMLLNLTVHINKEVDSGELYNSNLSHSFKTMTETLEKWLAEHYGDRFPAKDILPNLRELSDFRNKIAHGMIEKYDDETETFTLNLVSRSDKDEWGYMTIEYELQALDACAKLANIANKAFIALADEIFHKEA